MRPGPFSFVCGGPSRIALSALPRESSRIPGRLIAGFYVLPLTKRLTDG
jgi:hypothetical protein